MKTKWIAVLLSAVSLISLSGCRMKSEDGKPVETTASETTVTDAVKTNTTVNPNTTVARQAVKKTEADTVPKTKPETEKQEATETQSYENLPDPNTSEMVDYIASKARESAESATTEQLQEAVDFLKNNTKSYFSGNENMENTMYYGCLLEYYYSGTNNEYERIGFQAFKTVKYVYRGIDSVFDEVTYNNVLKLQEMAENLNDIQ